MLDHVLVRVADRSASEAFYDTVLAPLGVEAFHPLPAITRWENLGVTQADDDHAVTTGLHVAFAAGSREAVDAVWRAGTAAGHTDDGAPGPRPEYGPDYYGAFLRDPDGNSVEAVHDGDGARTGTIDHLWLRVADLGAARAFYADLAPHTGFALETDDPGRAQFRGDVGTFSLLPGEPTRHLHVAFSAPDQATVRAFHAAALAAGHPDNGAPGDRPVYGEGYYGAFVLDPDGTNVEVVHMTA